MNTIHYYQDNGRPLLTILNANVIPNIGDEIELTDARLRFRVTRRVLKFTQGKQNGQPPVEIYLRAID